MQKTTISNWVWMGLLPLFLVAHAVSGQTAPDSLSGAASQGTPSVTGISGVVSSDRGVQLPGVIVSAVELSTGTQRAVAADGTGHYEMKGLLPGGPYIVQVRYEGFRPLSVTNVYLAAGRVTPIDLTLNTQTVEVGTRRGDRTALESAVPVDVIDMAPQAQQAPHTDVTQLLTYMVPSFNATRQTNAGGSDFVELGSLRGLGTDQLLVLVNGKRRHTTALLSLLGNRGVGTVGTDLNTLSSNALDRVEILRDGAAAQYGSDAIAGVMNIALKSNDHGGNVLASSGITSYGDGYTGLFSVNKGLKLGDKGFLSATIDADYRDPITRGYSRDVASRPVFSTDPATEASNLVASGKTYADFKERNGDARTYNYRGILNASVQASSKVKLYGFGGYNYRRGDATTPWVLPGTQFANIIPGGVFPIGYQPHLYSRIHDASGAAGAVFDLGGYSLDVSHTVGYNQMRFNLDNTQNPTQGYYSGTAFEAGGFQFAQNVTNITLNRLFGKVLAGTNVAVGAELRTDQYEIVPGEDNSWGNIDNAKRVGATPGAQGFTGFSAAVKGSRRNVGAFLDVEADITRQWTVSGALRFENYTDFGSAVIVKATTRYQLARALAVRGAFNTGFRAPSLQQVLYQEVRITSSDALGNSTSRGIYNNQDEVTRAAGIPILGPEKSRNYSAGLVFTPVPGLSVTVDGYLIDIDDRIILSGRLGSGITPAFTSLLEGKGITEAQFFTNSVDTRSQGLDLTARYQHELGQGTFTVTAAGNFTNTRVQRIHVPENFQGIQSDVAVNNDYVDKRQLSLFTTGNPNSKIFLHLGYEIGKFSALLRNTYYGKVSYYDTNPASNIFGSNFLVFNPRIVTDLLLTYSPTKPLAITLGANNLFNILPNTLVEAARNGFAPSGNPTVMPENRDIYPYAPVQMGYGGTLVYAKVAYNFGL